MSSSEPNLSIITSFPQYPTYTILLSLFTNVKNSADVRAHLIAGNQDYQYAFIDPTSIYSVEQLLAATYRAINDTEAGCLRTKNIHSEIIFSLSHQNNIMDSLRRFGVSDKSTSLIAIKLIETKENETTQLTQETSKPYIQFLQTAIDGDLTRISNSQLADLHDLAVIKKNYKFPATVTTPHQIQNAIISSISLRGA